MEGNAFAALLREVVKKIWIFHNQSDPKGGGRGVSPLGPNQSNCRDLDVFLG